MGVIVATAAAENNVTRDEAQERARLLNVAAYRVELDLTGAGRGERTFRSSTTVAFTTREPGAATHIDITADRIVSATLNGRPIDPQSAFTGHRLALTGLAESNELHVEADCVYMRTGEGLHRFVDPVDERIYLYTQFETFDAHRMYACFDQPDLKASFELSVTVPSDWVVVSNSQAQVSDADGGSRWVFAPTPRISTYVTALVAGHYHEVRDEHDGIPLGLYCRQSLAEHLDAEALFEVTKQGFDFYHRLFDYRYPFGKYDQCFVPEFNAGAMENVACVTFLEDYVFRSRVTDAAYERRAETVLHEMAHMWFGDLVTMRWFDDLWLNESFATYASVVAQSEATRWRDAWTTFANMEKTWAYRQDQLPTTHPVVADIVDNEAVRTNFDGITYAKGASVLKQLVHWVGREEFFAGIRAYFRAHEYGNTTLADLLVELAATSGRDLREWSRQWLQTAGVNTLRARVSRDVAGMLTEVVIEQSAPPEHPTLRPHRLAVGLYDLTDDGLVRRSRVELDVRGEQTPVPQLAGVRAPDLLLVNDDDLTYAKTRLDPASLATAVAHIGHIPESLPRALVWDAAWDMTRDAEMRGRDYLALVLAGIDREGDIGLVQSLQRLATSAILTFSDPAYRPEGLRRLADAGREHLHRAQPGSDHQLAWARAFVAVAHGAEDVRRLRGLLDGAESVPGLVVDAELRWHVVRRLAALGQVDEDELAAELARDNTAQGRRHLLAARAARPLAAAKEEAWRLATDSESGLPNAEHAAVIAGFTQVEQTDLLRPYRDRYFGVIDELWHTWTNEMASQVVVGLFPGYLIEEETLAAADAWIARGEAPPALRRLVLEGRDAVARALRAQAFDASGPPAD